MITLARRRQKPTHRGQMSSLRIRQKLRRWHHIFFPQIAVADVPDNGKKAASFGVISPGDTSFLKSVWHCLEIEAGSLWRAVAVFVDHCDCSPRSSYAIDPWPRICSIVNGATRLCCNGKKMVRKAGTMYRGEVVISQG